MGLGRPRFLRKILSRWHEFTTRSQYRVMKPSCCQICHKEIATCTCGSLKKVPHGFLALYVGTEEKRFLVPAASLNHPAFRELLEQTQEEFGFSQKGALRMPCKAEDLILALISAEDGRQFPNHELENYQTKEHRCFESARIGDSTLW